MDNGIPSPLRNTKMQNAVIPKASASMGPKRKCMLPQLEMSTSRGSPIATPRPLTTKPNSKTEATISASFLIAIAFSSETCRAISMYASLRELVFRRNSSRSRGMIVESALYAPAGSTIFLPSATSEAPETTVAPETSVPVLSVKKIDPADPRQKMRTRWGAVSVPPETTHQYKERCKWRFWNSMTSLPTEPASR